jgi:hypothetical protein
MSLEQVRRYALATAPLISAQSRINIVGGEPTLHPQIFEVLDILVEVIRPRMKIPIQFFSSGIGSKVNQVLGQIRQRYITQSAPFYPVYNYAWASLVIRESHIQFYVINTKGSFATHIKDYINKYHIPIFRAAQDLLPYCKDYVSLCKDKLCYGYSLSPYGIYICSVASTISRIFKLGEGLDHIPSTEEDKEQVDRLCHLCAVPCSKIPGPDITKSYEEAIEAWYKEPYFLKPLS